MTKYRQRLLFSDRKAGMSRLRNEMVTSLDAKAAFDKKIWLTLEKMLVKAVLS